MPVLSLIARRVGLLIALALSSTVFIGCGGSSNPVAGPTPIAAPAPAPAPSGPGANDAIGRWTGTVVAQNPCSVNTPTGTYAWTGTITKSGETFTMEWRDAYFDITMRRSFPSTSAFSFVISDDFDTFTLTGRFAADWQSLAGEVAGRVDCVTSIRTTTGTWTGQRTGP